MYSFSLQGKGSWRAADAWIRRGAAARPDGARGARPRRRWAIRAPALAWRLAWACMLATAPPKIVDLRCRAPQPPRPATAESCRKLAADASRWRGAGGGRWAAGLLRQSRGLIFLQGRELGARRETGEWVGSSGRTQTRHQEGRGASWRPAGSAAAVCAHGRARAPRVSRGAPGRCWRKPPTIRPSVRGPAVTTWWGGGGTPLREAGGCKGVHASCNTGAAPASN